MQPGRGAFVHPITPDFKSRKVQIRTEGGGGGVACTGNKNPKQRDLKSCYYEFSVVRFI